MSCRAGVVWHTDYPRYDLGPDPTNLLRSLGAGRPPVSMEEGRMPQPQPWTPDGDSRFGRFVQASRTATFLLGLVPRDPRD